MDELAAFIGCTPSPLDYLVSDPVLAYRLLFCANLSYVYRLKGSHRWEGARDAIVTVDERVLKATQTRDTGVTCEESGYFMYLVASALLIGLLAIVFVNKF